MFYHIIRDNRNHAAFFDCYYSQICVYLCYSCNRTFLIATLIITTDTDYDGIFPIHSGLYQFAGGDTGQFGVQVYLGLKNGDPGRIAAQVITGVGFLGGGAMIHLKGVVRGLTTAAGIWMTATIGMAVGVGMYWCAIIATVMILITLTAFEVYEQRRNMGQENRALRVIGSGIVNDLEPYREVFHRHSVHLSTYFLKYDYENDLTELNFVVLAPSHRNYLPMFQDLRNLGDTKTLILTSQG